jgi:nickel transport protein
MKRLSYLLAGALAAGAVVPVEAHGIWFAQRAKQLAIIYGVGADDLEAVKRQPMMHDIKAYDADYQPIPAALRTAGSLVIVDTDAAPTLVTAVLDNGTWSWLPSGEIVKKGRDEAPTATRAETTLKYAVTIQGALSKPIPPLAGQVLQIVPVGAIPAKLGMPLTYRVLYKGKPAAGAELINDMVNDPDATPVKTGADGTATMPVRNQGLNVIRAVHVGPTDNPKKIDRYEYTATLAFTLAHAPE